MNNGILLIAVLGVILILGVCIKYFIWRSRIRDKESIDGHWEKFVKANSRNDIGGIKVYAEKLIWNKYLKQEQLSFITEVLSSKREKYPALEKLRLDAYNKLLDYQSSPPEPGSTGGFKQSW